MTFLIMQRLLFLLPYAQASPSTPYSRTCSTYFYICTVHLDTLFFLLALQPIVGLFLQPSSGLQPPRVRGFLITHNDAPQSVGLLWTSDQLVAETST